ncbi:MAG: hypothetical protein R3E66_19760 [bacterium]
MKALPAIISILGVVGMALSMTFVFAAYLAFQPGWSELTYTLVGRSDRELTYIVFLAAGVPYVLLLTHLFLRTRLGGFYLTRGRSDLAQAYCSQRLKISWLRSATEVAFHRLYLCQAYVRQLDYEQARKTLAAAERVPRRLQDEYIRWELEIALRQEDLVRCNALKNELRTKRERPSGLAWAAVAELATRQRDPELFDVAIKNARWALADEDARLVFALQAGHLRLNTQAPAKLDATAFLAEVPGAALEWACLAGLDTSGVTGDSRSHWCVENQETACRSSIQTKT